MDKTFRRTMRILSTLAIFSAFGIMTSIGMKASGHNIYASDWTSIEKATVNNNVNSELPEIEIKKVNEPYKY